MAGQTGHVGQGSYQSLVTHSYDLGAATPIDLRNLGSLAHTAQVQYQRQLKTLQALQKQAELTAEYNAAWREREQRREEKYAQIDQERQAQQEVRVENAQRVAEARAARYEAAVRHEEALRAAAAAKVHAVEDRLARFMSERNDHAAAEAQRIAAAEAKREATYRANLELLEARRQALLAREQRVEDILRQREELRQLQLQIRAEEDALREHQRRAIKQRAETDLGHRVAHFHARNVAKDEQTTRRKQELEQRRQVRAEELRQRFEYIAAQAHEAAAVAEAERQSLAARLGDKAARGEALAAQRQALLAEMQGLRQQMQRQEEVIRSSLLRMRQQGSVALPEEVARSLEGLQAGGPVRATAVMGGGRGPGLLEAAPVAAAVAGGAAYTPTSAGAPRQAGRSASAKRRPRSAQPMRGHAAGHVATERTYLTAMLSPRVGQPGKMQRLAAAAASRPFSANADFRHHPRIPASPITPTRTRPATTAATSGPSPYSSYTVPSAAAGAAGGKGGRRRGRQPSVEEQVAAATNTADAAMEAAASGRYTGVHEVGRPGSRREEELRVVLQEEIAKEAERQAMLAKVTDDAERARLIKYFTLEREEAKRRILALSNAAQAALYP